LGGILHRTSDLIAIGFLRDSTDKLRKVVEKMKWPEFRDYGISQNWEYGSFFQKQAVCDFDTLIWPHSILCSGPTLLGTRYRVLRFGLNRPRGGRVDRRAKVELFEPIRREYGHGGGTIRGIAKKLGIHRRMVREAVLRAVPVERKTPVRGRPKLEPAMGLHRCDSGSGPQGATEATAYGTSHLVPDPSGDAGSGSSRVHDSSP
jgi:hypothetical protein